MLYTLLGSKSRAFYSVALFGDLDRSRSMLGCDVCVGGDAGLDGGDPGPSFSRAARALVQVSIVVSCTFG